MCAVCAVNSDGIRLNVPKKVEADWVKCPVAEGQAHPMCWSNLSLVQVMQQLLLMGAIDFAVQLDTR